MSRGSTDKSATVWRSISLIVPIFLLILLLMLGQKNSPPDVTSDPVPFSESAGEPPPLVPLGVAPQAPVGGVTTVNGIEIPRGEPPPLLRGANNRLFYPEAVIETRDPVAGTLFDEPILVTRTGVLAGRLTLDEHTASAIEAGFDPGAVWRFVDSKAEFIEIPLEVDRSVIVDVEKVIRRGGRTHTLLGKVRNEPLSDVLLVFHDGAVSGSVAFMGIGEHYQFAMAGNGDVAIRHLDPDTYTERCGAPGDPSADLLDPIDQSPGDESPGEETAEAPAGWLVMDTVIGYSALARSTQGGTSAMEAKVLEGIDRLNSAIVNSLVDSSFVSLVATIEDPDYVDPGSSSSTMGSADELGDLNSSSSSNPELNTISDLRIALGADHNGFVVNSTQGAAGVAYRPGRSMLVARTYISSTRLTFAHEFGHNIGCSHSWGDTSGETSTSVYRWGWRLDPPTSGRVRTIMAYDWGWQRIPYFSNPLVEYDGTRTGQVDGYDATGDAESDSRYVSGGLVGSAGAGFDGTNPNLGARNADYFEERDEFLADNATRTSLAVFDPGAGDSWARGSTYSIFWYGGDHTDTVEIDLYKGGVFQYAIDSAAEAHLRYYRWTVPIDQTMGSDYQIRVTLNGTSADSANFTISEANEPPTDIILSSSSVDENSPAGTAVGTLSSVDAEGGPFTYSLVGGTGSTDNQSFTVSGSVLQTDQVFNFEVKSSYSIRLRTADSQGAEYEEAFIITVNDIVEPFTPPRLTRIVVPAVSSSGWTPVDLGATYTSPVVVATPIYPDGAYVPMVARLRNASGRSCEVQIVRVDGLTEEVSCDVSVIAVEEGVYNTVEHGATMEAVKYVSTRTDRKNNWVGESRSYQNPYSSPVVLGQVMSANDPDWSVFWCRGSAQTNPPNASNLFVGKSICEDPDTARVDETIGYIVIEAGSGSIEGIDYTAGVGADNVSGYGNSSTGYTYPITGIDTISAAVLTCAGLDGGDGGWAVLFGSSALAPSALNLVIAEDQLSDSEISHTTEQIGYLALEGILNSAPTDISLTATSVDENQPVGTPVGALSSADSEGGAFSYSLVSGTGADDNASFTISGSNLLSNVSFDHEAQSSHSIRIRSTDSGGLFFEKAFVISINNLIEIPMAPTGLMAAGGVESVSLSWNDTSDDETGFSIERSTVGDGIGFNRVDGVSTGTTHYVDSGLPAGATFFYRVIATGLEGDSPSGGEASATVFTHLEGWRSLNGLPPNGGEDTTDGDSDGLSALMEFALVLDPNVMNTEEIPTSTMVEEDGETYLTYSFRRRSGGNLVDNTWRVDGISYRVEVTTSLGSDDWEHGEDVVQWEGNPIDNGDGSETVRCRVRVESSDSRSFIRLAVEQVE